jgi:hypothetical protein
MSLLQSSLFPEIMLERSGWQLDASLLNVIYCNLRSLFDISSKGTQASVVRIPQSTIAK